MMIMPVNTLRQIAVAPFLNGTKMMEWTGHLAYRELSQWAAALELTGQPRASRANPSNSACDPQLLHLGFPTAMVIRVSSNCFLPHCCYFAGGNVHCWCCEARSASFLPGPFSLPSPTLSKWKHIPVWSLCTYWVPCSSSPGTAYL